MVWRCCARRRRSQGPIGLYDYRLRHATPSIRYAFATLSFTLRVRLLTGRQRRRSPPPSGGGLPRWNKPPLIRHRTGRIRCKTPSPTTPIGGACFGCGRARADLHSHLRRFRRHAAADQRLCGYVPHRHGGSCLLYLPKAQSLAAFQRAGSAESCGHVRPHPPPQFRCPPGGLAHLLWRRARRYDRHSRRRTC